MNYNGFKTYLKELDTDVRGFANMVDAGNQYVDPDTGNEGFNVLAPVTSDLYGGNSPGLLQDFYVWLHTAARELSNEAKQAIEEIDETSPSQSDVRAVAELAQQVAILNSLVNGYGDKLAEFRPWVKMSASTMEVYRFWNDKSGKNYGEPDKRGMETKQMPTQKVKIVCIESEDGRSTRAAVSCSNGQYRIDESVGGVAIASAYIFDMPLMMAKYLSGTGGRRSMGALNRESIVVETMQKASSLMHGLCDMAETMNRHGVLRDVDNLYMLNELTTIKPSKGVVAEESPDAKIEIGSWS